MVQARFSTAVGVFALLVTSGCQSDDPAAHQPERSAAPAGSSTTKQATVDTPGTSGAQASRIDDPRVSQSSGLARSHLHPGVLYTHNDRSTSAPHVFAVDDSGTRAVLTLEGSAIDWEDMATTPDGQLWVGDIGDNDGVRTSIAVHVAKEPAVLTSSTLPTVTYQFTFPDGAHNAEALLVHPVTHRVYVVSKVDDGGQVFAAPEQLDGEESNELELLGEAPPNVTSGDYSDDGSMFVLRNQGRAYFYRDFSSEPVVVALPKQPQGEAITFEQDGRHVLLGSEGTKSRILRLAVPSLPD